MTDAARARFIACGGVASSAVIYGLLSFGSLLSAAPGPLRALRTAFWHDQLGYLSIVADVAAGDLANREPVTQTGVNHYPRTYYTLVGLVARLFGLDPVFAWNAISVALQVSAVAALAYALARVSGRSWMAFLAPLPFFAGVMAFRHEGEWFTSLESHAVLWGPYGVMFSNNAETAGLSIIVICMSLLASVWLRSTPRLSRTVTTVIIAALLGLLSGFQTYSFLSGAYVMAYLIAARFLLEPRRLWWVLLTAAVIAVVFVFGPAVADRVGQLPTLIFGLLPAAPGLVRGLLLTRGSLAGYAVVFTAAAVPQVAWTMSGVLSGDPFLTYRVASNVDLGVTRPGTLVASLVVAVPLLTILGLAWKRGRPDAGAYAGAVLVTWVVLATNDLWGANAEPYRFWIDMSFIAAVAAMLAASRLYAQPQSQGTARPDDYPPAATSRRGRLVEGLAWSVIAILYAVSLIDYITFRVDPAMNASWNPATPRAAAIADVARLAASEGQGLILTDPCIDPRTTKVTSASPMAFYYLGMAWPEKRDGVQDVMTARDARVIDASAMAAADATWLISDTRCGGRLTVEQGSLVEVSALRYGDTGGTLRLWRYEAD